MAQYPEALTTAGAPAPLLTRRMLVSRALTWRIAFLGLCLMGLALLSPPSHALSLGGLAISSRTAPHFSASVPFSDNHPVRLSELQTRIATDAEHAQWGLQQPPSEIRHLRIRVVPASKTVGYIELYSLTPLSQESFDLLIWASYAGQTILTQYKVALLDLPTLIEGKTLSASHTPTAKPALSAKSTKLNSVTEISTDLSQQVSPQENLKSIPPAPQAMPISVMETQVSSVPRPTSTSPADKGLVKADQTWTEDLPSIYGLVIGCCLLVFLIGFLLGKRPQTAIQASTSAAPNKRDASLRSPVQAPTQAGASGQPAVPPHSTSEFLITERFVPVDAVATVVHPTAMAAESAGRITSASKACATALPTPGLRMPAQRHMPDDREKSAGKANIDLAKIYLSMGDPSTAQMVLQEVIQEGSESEKAIAQQLLKQMA